MIEGRRPNVHIAASVAAAIKQKANYVRTAGFDNEYYRDLIVKFLQKFGQASSADVQETLFDKLPDALTYDQKRRRVQNLLQDLQRRKVIHNASGKRGSGSLWKLLD